ncbi:hypothetical protein [Xylocopilactobacillus apis]|uniref:Uncharacterized protein n=1 Tax=Xylocopilactobacillus apis TaxID=2932183 RepID=A0AAU9CU83_9LACO|nr:hypothetical protein [Xylocopilactobacillus apis]BDR57547.1 hypothetical protein KIMC2_21090 [Xylocopilactobacillus apis]
MKSFEKYHPLLTEHYKMDWLTAFPLKDIILKIGSASETAKFINQQMRLVMANQKLFYGVADRSSNLFLGFVEITFIGETAQIDLSLDSDEIVLYLTEFLKSNFGVKKIFPRK